MTEERKTEQEPNKGEPKLVGREVVIEASRQRYGMPRAEVERSIARQMGWPMPEEQRGDLLDRLSHRLQGLGMTERQAKYLLGAYSPDRIQQQLDWLAYRGAHNPAAFIVAAIRRNYEAPEGLYVDDASRRRSDLPETQDEARTPPEGNPNAEQEPKDG